jgi:hypothetical protein
VVVKEWEYVFALIFNTREMESEQKSNGTSLMLISACFTCLDLTLPELRVGFSAMRFDESSLINGNSCCYLARFNNSCEMTVQRNASLQTSIEVLVHCKISVTVTYMRAYLLAHRDGTALVYSDGNVLGSTDATRLCLKKRMAREQLAIALSSSLRKAIEEV